MRLILASTSPYRRDALDRLGLPYEAIAPTCDEEALKEPALDALSLARHLAREKARSVAQHHVDAFVLGADQLVELDGAILGKPYTSERAVAQLARLSGRTHRLITAFALVLPGGAVDEHVDVHTLQLRSLTHEELARYVAADAPLDCAGSYKVERRGIALFERIEGGDFTAITGLPLIALTSRLRAHGFALP